MGEKEKKKQKSSKATTTTTRAGRGAGEGAGRAAGRQLEWSREYFALKAKLLSILAFGSGSRSARGAENERVGKGEGENSKRGE